jgi:hypothetical protein
MSRKCLLAIPHFRQQRSPAMMTMVHRLQAAFHLQLHHDHSQRIYFLANQAFYYQQF